MSVSEVGPGPKSSPAVTQAARRTIAEIAKCKGRKRALQIFTAWAFDTHSTGFLMPPTGSEGTDGLGGDEDLVALANSALLRFGKLTDRKRQLAASGALMKRHRDGIEPTAGSVRHDCERVYAIAVRLELKGDI